MQVQRPITMKKDGIQTRNRKVSTKGKKKKEDLRYLDKPFPPFTPSYPGMHQSHYNMAGYMAGHMAGHGGLPAGPFDSFYGW